MKCALRVATVENGMVDGRYDGRLTQTDAPVAAEFMKDSSTCGARVQYSAFPFTSIRNTEAVVRVPPIVYVRQKIAPLAGLSATTLHSGQVGAPRLQIIAVARGAARARGAVEELTFRATPGRCFGRASPTKRPRRGSRLRRTEQRCDK